MFKITCTTSGVEHLIYAPNVPDYRVIAPMLSMELNKSGLLTFGVPDAHPNRAQILPLTSDITVYEDGVAIWYGRSITNEKDFYKTGKITCEGELAFLYDSIYRPFSYAGTITNFLTALIANHNAQVETRKEFTLGTVSVIDSNGNVARSSEAALKTLDVIQTRLIDTNGGYLRVRHSGGVRYLDYLATYGNTATQKIEFAKNLIDLTQFVDATKVRTVLIPYGAEIPGAADGERLTIESVNSGLDYIANAGAVSTFGQIWETVIFDDVTVAANLLTKATAYLSELIAQAVTLKLSMVDLAVLGVETRINIGDMVQAISVPHGLNSSFLATSVNLDILHPELARMSFGNTRKAFTSQNNQTKLDVSKSVDAVNARILLASQLITGAVGGYVVLDPPEKPERILIMDTADMATAANVWQFNVNGLGFSSTGIDGPYKTAMTMDGQIVSTATIDGKTITVSLNSTDAISVTVDGTKVFGVDSNGQVFASRLSTNADPSVFGIVGYDAVTFTFGLSLFDLVCQAAAWFAVKHAIWGSGNDAGFSLHNGVGDMVLNFSQGDTSSEANTLSLYSEPANGLYQLFSRFLATHTYTEIRTQDDVTEGESNALGIDKDGMYFDKYLTRFRVIDLPGQKMELVCPTNTDNAIGVDATGAYKITAGVKAYL